MRITYASHPLDNSMCGLGYIHGLSYNDMIWRYFVNMFVDHMV